MWQTQLQGTRITSSACFAPITQGSATNCIAAEHKCLFKIAQNLELIMQATTAVLFFAFLQTVKNTGTNCCRPSKHSILRVYDLRHGDV